MSGNSVLYSLLFAGVENALVTECTSVEMKRMGGGQVQHTIAKRFAGISPGSSFCTMSLTMAVPAAGFEYDPGTAIDGYIPTELAVIGPGGQTAKSKGFILEDDIKHGVDQPVTHTISFIGPLPQWE